MQKGRGPVWKLCAAPGSRNRRRRLKSRLRLKSQHKHLQHSKRSCQKCQFLDSMNRPGWQMSQLKKEINALCAQLGQPPRYPFEDKEAPL